MRVVYGAGAVAVVSVIAVGLVQPDYAATADQQPTNDPNLVADANSATDASAANDPATQGNQGSRRNRKNDQSNPGSAGSQPDVQVNHIVKYIHLKPGQTAPPGATVIQPGQPTPKVVVANQPAPTAPPAANKPPAHNPAPNKPPVANPPPANKPPVNPPPRPTPQPTVKSHQSGRPYKTAQLSEYEVVKHSEPSMGGTLEVAITVQPERRAEAAVAAPGAPRRIQVWGEPQTRLDAQ
jgi:hypothetical protein